MSITDELREFIESHLYLGATALGGWKEAAFAIADRIDKAYESSYKDGYDEGAADILAFCDRLKEAAEGREDVTLWGIDYVALPLDADGEPIHVGDVMTFINGSSEQVRFMTLNLTGWLVNDRGWWPSNLHHHHTLTVEGILEDMIAEASDCDTSELVERYSKLLALRGE